MINFRNRVYLFFWPEKLLRDYKINSIYLSLKGQSRKNGLFCRANFYLLLKISSTMVFSIVLFPINLFLYVTNYRFIYGTRFQQIGEIFLLDIAIKENKLNKNSKLILFYYPPFHDNSYLLSLYKKHVIFIDKTWLFPLLLPLSHSFLTRMDVVNLDTNCTNCKAADIFQKYQLQYQKPLIKMQLKDVSECENKISRRIQGCKFVCVHAREAGFNNGYYADSERTTRNADINTYDLLIDKLIELGYVVVRLGDPWMQSVLYLQEKYKENFVDYAHSDFRSEKMDVYLLSNCEFLVACSSGPSDVSNMFNINTLLLNGYPAVNSLRFLEGDISIFKKVLNIRTRKNIKFKKLFSKPFDLSLQHKDLKEIGYHLVDNSSNEMLNALGDFISIRKNTLEVNEKKSNMSKYFKKHHYGYNGSGKFSKSFIESYIDNSE